MTRTSLARGAGSHTAKACRFVLRRLEARESHQAILDALEERGCPEFKAEALLLGSVIAYDGLFSSDGRRLLEIAITTEGVPLRMARSITTGVLAEFDRILACALPRALDGRRAQLVPRLQQRVGLSLRSARAFTRLVIRVVDRVVPELGDHNDTFPMLDDLLDQLQAEGFPRLATARIVVGLYRHHAPSRVAG